MNDISLQIFNQRNRCETLYTKCVCSADGDPFVLIRILKSADTRWPTFFGSSLVTKWSLLPLLFSRFNPSITEAHKNEGVQTHWQIYLQSCGSINELAIKDLIRKKKMLLRSELFSLFCYFQTHLSYVNRNRELKHCEGELEAADGESGLVTPRAMARKVSQDTEAVT